MKPLTQNEILEIVKDYEAQEEAHNAERGVSPAQAAKLREDANVPRSCGHCNSLLVPAIVRGSIRYVCFDCAEATPER